MTISTLTGTAGTTLATSAANKARTQLGEKDFLLLLTTQLKQQDPTSPVDNKEMLAQMAQFSSVAGITEMGETLKRIADQLDKVMATVTTATPVAIGAPVPLPTA